MHRQMRYEKIKKQFLEGDVIHNFNGRDYLIVCRLNENTFLLMDSSSKNYVVGIGVNYLVRYPKEEGRTKDNEEYGIEWNHGRYLGNVISEDVLKRLREEFSEREREEDIPVETEYAVEIEEYLSRTVKMKASSYEEAETKVREMYYLGDIVLNSGDFIQVHFRETKDNVVEEEKNNITVAR